MATAVPKTYQIEIRDKDNKLKEIITPYVTKLSWEWLAEGGCGRCQVTVDGDYLRFLPEAEDNILIYLPPESGDAVLRYRGIIETASRSATGSSQKIDMDFDGYSSWFKRTIVHDSFNEKIYTQKEMSVIADDVLTTYVLPHASITKGTIEEGNFVADSLSFKGFVYDVLKQLAEFQGRVVWGVGPDRVFYWYNEVDEVSDYGKWMIGDKITDIKDRTEWRSIKNDIFLEGGKVNDDTFTTNRGSQGSQDLYGLRQDLESRSSITTSATASGFIRALLKKEGRPRRQYSAKLSSANFEIEDNLPFGLVEIIDKDEYQNPLRYGTTGKGSNIEYADPTDYVYGQTAQHHVDRIRYTLTPEDGKIDAQIQFGDSLAISQASAHIKQLELVLDAVRQRSL